MKQTSPSACSSLQLRPGIELLLLFILTVHGYSQKFISITIDDPHTESTPLLLWPERNDRILNALQTNDLKAALFVCGKRVDNDEGRELLKAWDRNNHRIANHSYSHFYFHSNKQTLQSFQNDFLKGDSVIQSYRNYTKLFRFPYLKEGNSIEKRDGFRNFLQEQRYQNGHVTIDASDWYVDQRLRDTLAKNPNADLTGYKEFYIRHILDRAEYYDGLAREYVKRPIFHTLLLHHNLLNALFLDALIQRLKQNGWTLIDADSAYTDSVYSLNPDVTPAGESLVWAIAKISGATGLRYPAEDGLYEKEKLDSFLLKFDAAWRDTLTGMNFQKIKPGEFLMGLQNDSSAPPHSVRITKPFFISRYEVTQKQWRTIMDTNPSQFKDCGDDCPVENVNWFEVKKFIEKLNARTGLTFRLPTETEWEYICRAGTSTAFNTGDVLTTDQANYDGNWPHGNSAKGIFRAKPLPVGSFAPNAWNIYDMHGNVWEWCEDDFCPYPDATETDPLRICSAGKKIIRGGSWYFGADIARSGRRYTHEPQDRGPSLGFRLVREITP
ncbi:SUMF1/EgtB/PvdO family nonheme iron enzyme [bacterium]|nr:SUMF1/EgtB/PvdO family nonheme iron enzyme [bacterium]